MENKGWGYESLVQCFPRMHKALGLNPSTEKEKDSKKRKEKKLK
jgi:hypothetical protein